MLTQRLLPEQVDRAGSSWDWWAALFLEAAFDGLRDGDWRAELLAGWFVGKSDSSYVSGVERCLILVTGMDVFALHAGSFFQVRISFHSTEIQNRPI